MADLPPRWYVRGTNDTHAYDRKVPVPRRQAGSSFCKTCEIFHHDPVGREWHIEGEDVDHMLCGLVIGVDEGEVRVRPAKNICLRCLAAAKKEARA